MQILWAPRARQQLMDIATYIAMDNERAAERVVQRIQDAVENLRIYPAMGRAGRIGGTRELVISGVPYVVVYTVAGGTLQVAAVIHTARQWPEKI